MKYFTLIILINYFIYINSNIADISCMDETVKVHSIKDCQNRKISEDFTHCCFQDYISISGLRHQYCVELNDDYYSKLKKNIKELETQLDVKILKFDCNSSNIGLNIIIFFFLIFALI